MNNESIKAGFLKKAQSYGLTNQQANHLFKKAGLYDAMSEAARAKQEALNKAILGAGNEGAAMGAVGAGVGGLGGAGIGGMVGSLIGDSPEQQLRNRNRGMAVGGIAGGLGGAALGGQGAAFNGINDYLMAR